MRSRCSSGRQYSIAVSTQSRNARRHSPGSSSWKNSSRELQPVTLRPVLGAEKGVDPGRRRHRLTAEVIQRDLEGIAILTKTLGFWRHTE